MSATFGGVGGPFRYHLTPLGGWDLCWSGTMVIWQGFGTKSPGKSVVDLYQRFLLNAKHKNHEKTGSMFVAFTHIAEACKLYCRGFQISQSQQDDTMRRSMDILKFNFE